MARAAGSRSSCLESPRKRLAPRTRLPPLIIEAAGGNLPCLDIVNVRYNLLLRVSPETFKSPDRNHDSQSKATAPRRSASCWPAASATGSYLLTSKGIGNVNHGV